MVDLWAVQILRDRRIWCYLARVSRERKADGWEGLTSLHADEATPDIKDCRIQQSGNEAAEQQYHVAPCLGHFFFQIQHEVGEARLLSILTLDVRHPVHTTTMSAW